MRRVAVTGWWLPALVIVFLAGAEARAGSLAELSATLGTHDAAAGAGSIGAAAARSTVTSHLPGGSAWASGVDDHQGGGATAKGWAEGKGWAAPRASQGAGKSAWVKAGDKASPSAPRRR